MAGRYRYLGMQLDARGVRAFLEAHIEAVLPAVAEQSMRCVMLGAMRGTPQAFAGLIARNYLMPG